MAYCQLQQKNRFDNSFYRQIDGVAMGSWSNSLAPILANAFWCHYEKE